jgi:hypothetical protein
MSAIALDLLSSIASVESRILLMDSTSAFVPDVVTSDNHVATELLRSFPVLLELTSMEVPLVPAFGAVAEVGRKCAKNPLKPQHLLVALTECLQVAQGRVSPRHRPDRGSPLHQNTEQVASVAPTLQCTLCRRWVACRQGHL